MVDILPNFGVQYFETKAEAVKYLLKFNFSLIISRSDYDVYETKEKKRANLYQEKDGRWFVGQHIERV